MKIIRFLIRALVTWSLLLFLLGGAFAASPHAAEDLLGMIVFGMLAGGLLSLFRRQGIAPADQAPQSAPAGAPPAAVRPDALTIPGVRGAQMGLAHVCTDDAPSTALAVTFRGQTKAYVTRDDWHPVGEFAGLDTSGPEYRLVALMSLYAQTVLECEVPYAEQDAIAFAAGQLVPRELLERGIPDPSATAAWLGLPADVLTPQNLNVLRAAIATLNAAEVPASERS